MPEYSSAPYFTPGKSLILGSGYKFYISNKVANINKMALWSIFDSLDFYSGLSKRSLLIYVNSVYSSHKFHQEILALKSRELKILNENHHGIKSKVVPLQEVMP